MSFNPTNNRSAKADLAGSIRGRRSLSGDPRAVSRGLRTAGDTLFSGLTNYDFIIPSNHRSLSHAGLQETGQPSRLVSGLRNFRAPAHQFGKHFLGRIGRVGAGHRADRCPQGLRRLHAGVHRGETQVESPIDETQKAGCFALKYFHPPHNQKEKP